MFSRRKRSRDKLERIARTSDWIPEYHSLSEIESFNAHFKVILAKCEREKNYDYDKALGPEEKAWVDNEYRICACDYRYWSSNYAFINASGEIKRFERRASQEMLLSLWAEREELGYGIEQQILKARQQGHLDRSRASPSRIL